MIEGVTLYGTPIEFRDRLANDIRAFVRRRLDSIERIRQSVSVTHSPTQSGKASGQKDVFICYSHKDMDWLERLKVYLIPLERDYPVEYWNDTKIKPGCDWFKEIETALHNTKVAILLVSAYFLASEFIQSEELPRLLVAAEEEGAKILPLIISPSRFLKTKLARFQPVNSPSQPLIGLRRVEVETILANTADAIEDALKA